MLKRKWIFPILLFSLFFADVSYAHENSPKSSNDLNIDIIETNSQSITVRVTRHWPTSQYYEGSKSSPLYRPIPRKIKVSQAKNGNYYSGYINLVSYYLAKGEYIATYSGTIYINNNIKPLTKMPPCLSDE